MQFFDEQGKAGELWTAEEFWVSQKEWRTHYTVGDVSWTQYGTAKGVMEVSGASSGHSLGLIYLQHLIDPLPNTEDLGKEGFTMTEKAFGGVKLRCFEHQQT